MGTIGWISLTKQNCHALDPGRILLLATKTDLTRESTAVLHSTLSILLVNIYMLGIMAHYTDTKVSAGQYTVKSSFEYFEIFYQYQYNKP